MAKKTNDTYTIMVNITLDTDIEVSAMSLEEALEKAKKLELTDVVSFDGNYNDGQMEVRGVFK